MHAHHIIAAGWYRRFFYGLSDAPDEQTENFPENGLILCVLHHNRSGVAIHPDYYKALQGYKKNPHGFKEVARRHDELASQKIPYWDTSRDDELWQIASERTEAYKREHPEDKFPYD